MTHLVVLGALCSLSLCRVSVEAALPTGAALVALSHHTFKTFDLDHDGLMTNIEWGMFKVAADPDGDGCMTLSEYQKVAAAPLDVAAAIFSAVDRNHHNCITMKQLDSEFTMMDRNDDGTVTDPEFEAFYMELFAIIETQATVG